MHSVHQWKTHAEYQIATQAEHKSLHSFISEPEKCVINLYLVFLLGVYTSVALSKLYG